MENNKLLYESREAVIKLFNGFSSIASETKTKIIHGEGRTSELAIQLKVLTTKKCFKDYQKMSIKYNEFKKREWLLHL